MNDSDNILSLLDDFTLTNPEDIASIIAVDFRKRRVEKNITRKEIAAKSDVALSNIVRFERTGMISLTNLIKLAMALGYTSEIKNIFHTPKYASMDELLQIRKNNGKMKAYKR